MTRVRPFFLSLAVAAAAYVVLSSYTDVPPRGISLWETKSWIDLQPSRASVRSRLTYVCHSWRHRHTAVYLPFARAHGQGAVENFHAQVAGPSSYALYADGVVLFLSMPPDSLTTVEFSFAQALSEKSFQYIFGVAKGWPLPPNLMEVTVTAPDSMRMSQMPRRRPSFAVPVDAQNGVVLQWE